MWRSCTARQKHPQPSPSAAGQPLAAESWEPRAAEPKRGLGSQALTSARIPGSRGTHSTSSGSSSDLMGDLVAADQRDDKLGWGGQYLSSGCPQPAPCPTAVRSRVPTCFPSAGDKGASMGTGQRVAARPCPLSPGGGRARLLPGRSPAGAAAPRWTHLLSSPQVCVLCGGPQLARRQRLRAAGRAAGRGWEARCWRGSRGTSLRRGLCRAGARSGISRSSGRWSGRSGRSGRGGDRTGLMAAPGEEGAPEPAPARGGREGGRSAALGCWRESGHECGRGVLCSLGSLCAAPSGTLQLCVLQFLRRCGWGAGIWVRRGHGLG